MLVSFLMVSLKPMTCKEFLESLRENDGKNIERMIPVFESNHLEVVVRGSSAHPLHRQNYQDIDLLASGKRADYLSAISVFESWLFAPYTPCLGPYVDEPSAIFRHIFRYNYSEGSELRGTRYASIDISFVEQRQSESPYEVLLVSFSGKRTRRKKKKHS